MNATTTLSPTMLYRLATARQRRTSAETSSELILICRASIASSSSHCFTDDYASGRKSFRITRPRGTKSNRKELVISNFWWG